MFLTLLLSTMFFNAGPATATITPIVDNDRVSVSNVTSPIPMQSSDAVVVFLSGSATFATKGSSPSMGGQSGDGRAVVIQLKEHQPSPIDNKSGYPLAFPRRGSKKILENARVVVWDYSWTLGEATPMHFHDKDVVVVFLEDGDLKSTTPDGKATLNPYKVGDVRFTRGDRTHTETLVRGKQHAIITELK